MCVTALASLAAACDNGSLNEDETTFHMRALNLVEDSPMLAIDLDDTTVRSLRHHVPCATARRPGRGRRR
jgi:hypothetical protein